MTGVLLLGGGGHCRSIIDVLTMCSLPIAGIVHGAACKYEPVLSYPALGRDADLPHLRATYSQALVTVGQIKTPLLRRRLFALLDDLRFSLPVVISPLAHVSLQAHLGRGTVIMHQALINVGVDIGENCIINTRALVEHDCVIRNHCHIAVGAVLCGNVYVEEGTFIGAGAILRQGVHIGKNCVIGMGAVVCKDLPEGSIYAGVTQQSPDNR